MTITFLSLLTFNLYSCFLVPYFLISPFPRPCCFYFLKKFIYPFIWCVCLYVFVCVWVCEGVYACVCMHMHVFMCVHVWVCVFVCVCLCESVCMYLYVYVSVWACVHVCACTCVCAVHACLHMWVRMFVYMCIHVHVCAYVFVCMCMCTCMCIYIDVCIHTALANSSSRRSDALLGWGRAKICLFFLVPQLLCLENFKHNLIQFLNLFCFCFCFSGNPRDTCVCIQDVHMGILKPQVTGGVMCVVTTTQLFFGALVSPVGPINTVYPSFLKSRLTGLEIVLNCVWSSPGIRVEALRKRGKSWPYLSPRGHRIS